MKRMFIIGSLLLVAANANAQSGDRNLSEMGQWSFQHYSVTENFKGEPSKPLLKTTPERTFRTQIRRQAAKGPNFAGHFTLAMWGCGSPCLEFVIIDAQSGLIYEPHFSVGCSDGHGIDADIEFRLMSRLLITTGFSDKLGCGTNFYIWDGKRLRLIHFEPWPHTAKADE